MKHVVFEALAAKVHVREEAEEHGIVGQRAVDLHAKIGGPGRNYEMVVG